MKKLFGFILILGGAALIAIGFLSATNTVALVLLGIVSAVLGMAGLSAARPVRRGRIRTGRRRILSSRHSPTTHISP
jgi:hypothetical protein